MHDHGNINIWMLKILDETINKRLESFLGRVLSYPHILLIRKKGNIVPVRKKGQ